MATLAKAGTFSCGSVSNMRTVYIIILLILSLYLAIAGYFLQRSKYWTRIWEKLGRPEVNNVKDLKALMKNIEK
jgi:hypothetical protein